MASLYEINTRLEAATLDDIADEELDRWAGLGFDWIWCLGVWQTGPAGRQVALEDPDLRREYGAVLPDFTDADVCGSCFAVTGAAVCALGGEVALRRLRERLRQRGLRLMLDFVPNHTALDHPWVRDHPEYYVHDAAGRLEHGRDPYFPPWTDTLQLNYGEESLQQAMMAELMKVAGLCDGVRCDMAMLLLPEVFERTWGIRPKPFWERAIVRVRAAYPEFVFMAEVYWGLEGTMQQLGFDYTYDKTLYDRLRDQRARPVRDHLRAEPGYLNQSAHFLENHDEARAAAAFPEPVHRAAAAVTYFCPGLRFFHAGQLEGRSQRIPVQLRRAPVEPVNPRLQEFYRRLLACLPKDGAWRLLDCVPAWDGNWTWDCFICFSWEGSRRLLVAVNYAPNQSQCYVRLPFEGWTFRLVDLMGDAVYDRSGDKLYLDMPAWGYHVFDVQNQGQYTQIPKTGI